MNQPLILSSGYTIAMLTGYFLFGLHSTLTYGSVLIVKVTAVSLYPKMPRFTKILVSNVDFRINWTLNYNFFSFDSILERTNDFLEFSSSGGHD
jgi:hypothetical protein